MNDRSPLNWLLRRNAALVYARPRLVISVCIALVAASGWFAFSNLGFKTGGSDLIAADDALHARFLEYQKEFREDEDFVLLVESSNPERNFAAAELIAAEILKDPALAEPAGANLFYKLDPSKMRERALYYLPHQQLYDAAARLRESEEFLSNGGDAFTLEKLFATVSEKLEPGGSRESRADAAEALGQLDFLTSILRQMRESAEGGEPKPNASLLFSGRDPEENPYVSFEDGRVLVMLLAPKTREPGFTPFSKSIARLNAILDHARRQFPEVKFGLTGEPVLGNDEQSTYQRDMSVASMITVCVVFLILVYAYRQPVRPLLGMSVLLAAITIALGYAALVVGHLNMLSVAFVVMIMGLGDDFVIHMITRYEEERRSHAPREALATAMLHSGHAIFMAALMTAISFGTMIFTGFLGLVEMGIIAGGGLLICAALCLTLLPALLLQQRVERSAAPRQIRHRITPVLLRLERAWLNHARIVVAITAGLIVACLLLIVRWREVPAAGSELARSGGIQPAAAKLLKASFDYDVIDLQNQRLNSVQTMRRLSELQPLYFAAVVADTPAETARLQEALLSQPSVGRVVSILGSAERPGTAGVILEIRELAARLRFTPTAAVDAERLRALLTTMRERLSLAEDAVRLARKRELAAPLKGLREAVEAFLSAHPDAIAVGAYQQRLGEFFEESLDFLADQQPNPAVGLEQLPEQLRRRYVGRTGKFLLEVYPKEDPSVKTNLEQFSHEVLAAAPNATGTPIEMNVFVDLLRSSYVKAAFYALGIVTLVIFLYFRALLPTVLCLVPLFCGVTLLLGVMTLFGLSFNPANIITLPLIVGIGVDNGVMILERFRHEPDIEMFSRNTGRAMLMSNVSTIAGFLSLALARHQGIASLGAIMALGVGLTMLVSLIALPSIIRILKRSGVKM